MRPVAGVNAVVGVGGKSYMTGWAAFGAGFNQRLLPVVGTQLLPGPGLSPSVSTGRVWLPELEQLWVPE